MIPDQSKKIGCLIMAAGNAERFQSNKLAAEYEGKPLIRRALEAVPAGLFSVVTVVTQYPEVEAMAEEFGFSHLRNRHPDWGISYTIRLGTEAMYGCDAIVYMVSDQPLLEQQSVALVVSQWQAHRECIVGAGHNGKRGNPCIFPREFFPELMALREDSGGNQVIRAHADRLLLAEIPQRELTDVDTRKALAELEQHPE
jgi:molybdenum cofactor cytidylyltransferase